MHDDDEAEAVIERLRQREAIWQLDSEAITDLIIDTARDVSGHLAVPELKSLVESAYARFVELIPLGDRVDIVLTEAAKIERFRMSVDRLTLFMLMDDESFVAATAATEFVRMAPLIDGDPQSRAREVVETILPHARNSGAVFGGMVSVGDRRLAPLLLNAEEALSWKDLEVAAFCNSGFPIVGRLELWLTALEKYIEQQQTISDSVDHWYSEMRVGKAMTGLERIVVTAQTDEIVDAETEFGYPFFDPPREPLRRLETVPLKEIGHRYAERFWAVESRETVPRAMPYVMGLYGVEPRSPKEEWWEPPTPAADEDWDEEDDEAAYGSDSEDTAPRKSFTWLERLSFLLGWRGR